jgi:4-hydroxybenzoate polyprenyltransferase
LLLIFIPLLVILKKLKDARQPVQFHNVSTYIKVVMFTGILSMAVIGFHH